MHLLALRFPLSSSFLQTAFPVMDSGMEDCIEGVEYSFNGFFKSEVLSDSVGVSILQLFCYL